MIKHRSGIILERSSWVPSIRIGLVVFSHPSEKYEFVNWGDEIPNIWENKKCFKPLTRICVIAQGIQGNRDDEIPNIWENKIDGNQTTNHSHRYRQIMAAAEQNLIPKNFPSCRLSSAG